MTLTREDLDTLKRYFEADQHAFDYSKKAYIKERPISERIEEVDPAFAFHVRQIQVRPSAGEGGKEVATITVHASLTIKGVTRENTGMASVLKSDPKHIYIDKKKTDDTYTNEANQAEKHATTDSLKRCARLFGVGRYLLDTPNWVKDTSTMSKWLQQLTGQATAQNSSKQDPLQFPENGQANDKKEQAWKMVKSFYQDDRAAFDTDTQGVDWEQEVSTITRALVNSRKGA